MKSILHRVLKSSSARTQSLTRFRRGFWRHCTLVTSAFAWDEVHRNIALKCPQRAPILNALKEQLEDTPTPGASAIAEAAKHGLPDKDAPILAAATVAEVDILVTGDRTHFGHLYGKGIAGLRVLSLQEALTSVLEDQ
ncbi:MAG: hypothetical protein ACLFTD_06960 [Halochromatium sp.]